MLQTREDMTHCNPTNLHTMLGKFLLHAWLLAFTIDVKNWTDAVRGSAALTNSKTKVERPEEDEKEEEILPKEASLFPTPKEEKLEICRYKTIPL